MSLSPAIENVLAKYVSDDVSIVECVFFNDKQH